jgi:hypothetical protein
MNCMVCGKKKEVVKVGYIYSCQDCINRHNEQKDKSKKGLK